MHRLLRLLSDPTRIRILAAVEPEELSVGEIAEILGMSQSRISNHLRLLRDGDALRGRREGSWTFYRNALSEDPARGGVWREVTHALADDGSLRADADRREAVIEARRRRSLAHFEQSEDNGECRLERESLPHELLGTLLPAANAAVDAGCGEGRLAEVLARRFRKVIALDHSAPRLERARRRVSAPNVEFREAEVDALPLPDASADAVFLSLVLHHVPEVQAALAEAFRVLRPGGRIAVADLSPHEVEAMREKRGDLRLGLDPSALARQLRQAGFRDVRTEPSRDRLEADAGEFLDLFLAAGQRPLAPPKRNAPRPRARGTDPRRKP